VSKFRKVFSTKHVFLPVVHVEDEVQAIRNSSLAADCGADGVFLINHTINHTELIRCYEKVRNKLPTFWIGLNCLDLGRSALGVVPHDTAGLWVDDGGITECASATESARVFAQAKDLINWPGLYFGGVAFKYQREVKNVEMVARLAVPFMDVVTTSGSGTGKAAAVSKVRAMKSVMGNHPLAIASGITRENVEEYMPYVDCYLVATGVSDSHTELNASKMRALAQVLKK
jgi:uncharacterized protein